MTRRLLVTILVPALAGCASDAPDPGERHADTVWMRVAWSVEPGVHAAADSLGDVSGVARDGDGNLYASDLQAAMVWVFGPDGGFLRGFGGKGEGPGEFQAPTGAAVSPGERLYVRDVYRVSVFGRDSATGLLSRLENTFPGPAYADWTSRRATRFDTTGAMLYPGTKWREDGTSAPYAIRFAPDGPGGDTVFVPSYATAPQLTAFVRTSPGGGRMLDGLNHVPFAPLPAWDFTPSGTVISGDGRTYRLVETGRDSAVATVFEREIAPREIPEPLRRDSLAALRGRIDSIPVSRDDVEGVPDEVWALELPDVFPALQAVHVGEAGDVWVRRWSSAPDEETVFDVFTRSGEYRHAVVLERAIDLEPTPVLWPDGVIGVTRHRLTDESIILRFERSDRPPLTKTSGPETG